MTNERCPKCGGPMKDCSHMYEGRLIESMSCLMCGQDDYPRKKGQGAVLTARVAEIKPCESCGVLIKDKSQGYTRKYCAACKRKVNLAHAADYRRGARKRKAT